MTLALAIGGWTFATFLLVKLWVEMDMRIQLEEALAEEAAENDRITALRDCFERDCV